MNINVIIHDVVHDLVQKESETQHEGVIRSEVMKRTDGFFRVT